MTDESAGTTRQVFRASGGRLLLAACAAGAIVVFVDILVRADLRSLLLLAPWVLLALWAVYVVGVASRVSADASGIEVQNLLRRTFVPWGHVRRIEMRWQIELTLDDSRTIVCFGGPSRSRPRRLGAGGQKEQALAETDVVAALRRIQVASSDGNVGPIRRGWDLPALIAVLVLCVWAVVAVMFAYGT